MSIYSKFIEWGGKPNPEGITNFDAIQMAITLVSGLGIALGLIVWSKM